MAATCLALVGHAPPPQGGPGDPLLLLPLAALPMLTAALHGTWRVPAQGAGGGEQHHVFPLRRAGEAGPLPSAVQVSASTDQLPIGCMCGACMCYRSKNVASCDLSRVGFEVSGHNVV